MMFAILRHYGIPEKIVSAIRVLYDDSESQVYFEGQLSKPFRVTTGVLQGDVLAPFLFIIVIDYISKLSNQDFGFKTHEGRAQPERSLRSANTNIERKLNDLAFADDIALLESTEAKAEEQLRIHNINANKTGLEINVVKTVQMRLNLPRGFYPATAPDGYTLNVDDNHFEVVEDFKYLGSYIGSTEKDVKNRIGLAWAAFAKLKSILTSSKTKVPLKMRLFDAACVSILLYGCESWLLSTELTNKLDVFARTCYRIMLGIKQKTDRLTNVELYKRVGHQRPVHEIVRERQLRFTGHCLRLPAEEPANLYMLYEYKNNTKPKLGRPRHTFMKQISNHLTRKAGPSLSVEEIIRYAKNKSDWKLLIAAPNQPVR
jgi:hypothetical protein